MRLLTSNSKLRFLLSGSVPNYQFSFGENSSDADADQLFICCNSSGTTVAPFLMIHCNTSDSGSIDWGLLDNTTQPGFISIDKNGKYASDTAMYSDAGAATPIMKKVGEFGSSLAGDIVRVTAGTNATAGWYIIDEVTSADVIVLDRNWCTGNVPNNGAAVLYHDFTMLSAEGICTRVTDGAPDDTSIEIDRAGWIIIDATANAHNGDLYWRGAGGWTSVSTLIAAAGGGTPSGTTVAETTLAGSAVAAGTSTEYSRGDHTHGTPDIANYLDNTAGGTDAETSKAPTTNAFYDHAVATTGVHGAGTATIATTADVTTHSALTTGVHGLGTMSGASSADYLLKQMLENDPLKLDATLSATGKYSGIVESGVSGTDLVFGDLCYLLAASTRWMKTLANTVTTANGKLAMACGTAAAADTVDFLLMGKISSTTFPTLTVGAPIYASAGTAGYVTGTASVGTSDYVVRIVGYGNTATELYFKPDNTYIEITA
jgi:hypothetical protein